METKPCGCGNTDVVYSELENQSEPACWECYYTYDPDYDYNWEDEYLDPPTPSDELPF